MPIDDNNNINIAAAAAWIAKQHSSRVEMDIVSAIGILTVIQIQATQIRTCIIKHVITNAVLLNLLGITVEELDRLGSKADQSLAKCTLARERNPSDTSTQVLHRAFQLSADSHLASAARMDRGISQIAAYHADFTRHAAELTTMATHPVVEFMDVCQAVSATTVSLPRGAIGSATRASATGAHIPTHRVDLFSDILAKKDRAQNNLSKFRIMSEDTFRKDFGKLFPQLRSHRLWPRFPSPKPWPPQRGCHPRPRGGFCGRAPFHLFLLSEGHHSIIYHIYEPYLCFIYTIHTSIIRYLTP